MSTLDVSMARAAMQAAAEGAPKPSGCVRWHLASPLSIHMRTSSCDRYLLSTADTGKVWVKLSAAYRSSRGDGGLGLGKALTRPLLEAFSAERRVWGSDWPHTQHQDLIDYAASVRALAAWVPEESTRAAILSRSARALFRFD